MSVWNTVLDILEHRHIYPTPGDLAHALDPRTVRTPALDLIDAELIRATTTPDARLIISMPPQEGKSTRVARAFPLWLLTQRPDTRIVIGSYGVSLARGHGRWIRDRLTQHPTLGITPAPGNSAVDNWRIAKIDGSTAEGGVLSVGVGSGLTGNPADCVIIDDPHRDRKAADSEHQRDAVWEWWTDTVSTRLAPGAPVIVILTRWHQDDLAGRLLAAEDGHLWRVINIPAQAEKSDPLGRAPGEYLTSARRDRHGRPRTDAQWDAIKTRVGTRTWTALYQGRPSPAAGGVLQRDWWSYWWQPPPLNGRVIQSWDMAFKGKPSSDFVVGQVWIQDGADLYLLDQVRGRWAFTETVAQVKQLRERWPMTTATLVEDKANGTAVIDQLRHTIPGLVPIEPEGGKLARTSAISPYVEAGNIHLPHPSRYPWVNDLIEEAAGFPNASHDDQVDALSQAVTWLLVTQPTRLYGTTFYDIG